MTNSRFTQRAHLARGLAVAFAIFALVPCSAAQQPPLRELVRAAIQNQIADDDQPHLFAWKERKNRGQETKVQSVVQTPDGPLTRVTLIDNKPLTEAQQKEENDRLRRMSDPDNMRRRRTAHHEDDVRTRKMLSVIPDAFDFTLIENTQAPNGHKLVRLNFTARPGFEPPTREAMVFGGMQGEMVLDETSRRLVKIDGTLFRDVNFGWGILGKLYKGGRFLIEQCEVTPTHWETSRTVLHFEGKALMIKSIHIDESEWAWDFQPVPAMSVAQAMDYLAKSSQPPQNAVLRP
jgi:hypothetical protein